MNKAIALLFCTLIISAPSLAHADLTSSFDVTLLGGIRTGQGSDMGKYSKLYGGFKVSLLELKISGNNRLCILAPGVNLQSNITFAPSVSPLMVVIPDKLALGVDIFPVANGGSGPLGVFIGIPFGTGSQK
jgi:hypothetical protein